MGRPTDAKSKGSVPRAGARGNDIRRYILENTDRHNQDLAFVTADRFRITRQAVSEHLRKLTAEGILIPSGNTRNRSYKLAPLVHWSHTYKIDPELAEDQAWSLDALPKLAGLSKNAMDIWQFCFTEMFNNAIDHSGGTEIRCTLATTAATTQILLSDNGVGIFTKIRTAMKLLDERHAILELSKGKLTTDPARHTGQGIFFTSRLLDSFDILSGGVFFTNSFGGEDWILDRPESESGTSVFMKLSSFTDRQAKDVFDQYSVDDDYGFTKTTVPVRLARFGGEKLVSRSQAKRVLARVDLFTTVVFDFNGVESIWQSFADEMFRVFALSHPGMSVLSLNANPEVQKAIDVAVRQRLADRQILMRSDP